MATGRTSPALCRCEDGAGTSVGDFVVKLRGGMDRGVTALLSELVASLLAGYFGISTPAPVLVLVDAEFAELIAMVDLSKGEQIRRSVGLNFGSNHLTGVTIWPIDKPIPDSMRQQALLTYAFDSLIQNPDRRFNNPNLFSRGDQLIVFDHELAFSFLEDVIERKRPWNLNHPKYLADHVFFQQLKGKPIDLNGFTAALAALPGEPWQRIVTELPQEWNNSTLRKIESHLIAVAQRSLEFAEEIRRSLA